MAKSNTNESSSKEATELLLESESQPDWPRFVVERKVLAAEMSGLERAAAGNNAAVPITTHVRIAANSNNTVEFTASDLDGALVVTLQARVSRPGATTLPARDLSKIVKALGGEAITIAQVAKCKAQVSDGKAVFSLPTLEAKDYPAIGAAPENDNGVLLPAQSVLKGIARVRFCVSEDQSRSAMSGALLVLDGSTMMLVATDGHRLSHTQVTTDSKLSATELRIIIRSKTLDQLEAALAAGGEASDTVRFQESQAFGGFAFRNKVILFRKVEGQFPNFSKFLEMKNPVTAKVKTQVFRQALETVAAIAEKGNQNVSLEFSAGKATLKWKDEARTSTDNIAVEYEGERLQIGFNARYLCEFARATEADEIHLRMKDATTAAMLFPIVQAEDVEQHTYVVMPVRF